MMRVSVILLMVLLLNAVVGGFLQNRSIIPGGHYRSPDVPNSFMLDLYFSRDGETLSGRVSFRNTNDVVFEVPADNISYFIDENARFVLENDFYEHCKDMYVEATKRGRNLPEVPFSVTLSVVNGVVHFRLAEVGQHPSSVVVARYLGVESMRTASLRDANIES